MRREADCVLWLKKRLAYDLRARTIKHADNFTAGIPDLEVFVKGAGASYVEVKRVGTKGRVRPNADDFPRLQWGTLLWISEFVPATYAIFLEDERRFLVVPPGELVYGATYEILPGTIDGDAELIENVAIGRISVKSGLSWNWRKL